MQRLLDSEPSHAPASSTDLPLGSRAEFPWSLAGERTEGGMIEGHIGSSAAFAGAMTSWTVGSTVP